MVRLRKEGYFEESGIGYFKKWPTFLYYHLRRNSIPDRIFVLLRRTELLRESRSVISEEHLILKLKMGILFTKSDDKDLDETSTTKILEME
ncbi:hypothetical protein pipiens_003803 [Culex pipiens pipiens]|uniref:Uncharacterized protein n=1 Tax=Culex pipiens pipiens TaxID=38569 RepID=A0ABD1CT18_CULPP